MLSLVLVLALSFVVYDVRRCACASVYDIIWCDMVWCVSADSSICQIDCVVQAYWTEKFWSYRVLLYKCCFFHSFIRSFNLRIKGTRKKDSVWSDKTIKEKRNRENNNNGINEQHQSQFTECQIHRRLHHRGLWLYHHRCWSGQRYNFGTYHSIPLL